MDKPFKFIKCDGEHAEIPASPDNWEAMLETIADIVGGKVVAIQPDGAEIDLIDGRCERYHATYAIEDGNGNVTGSLETYVRAYYG